MQVWQIAAGEQGRYYDDLYLKHDVMFLGPGRFGHFIEDEGEYDFALERGWITGHNGTYSNERDYRIANRGQRFKSDCR